MTALAEAVARSFETGEPERPALSPLRALGRRQLTAVELLGQSVATTAPAASMVLLPVTMLTNETLLAGLCTIVAATVVIALVAQCVAAFTRRLAASGGLYTFVLKGSGTRTALICGAGLLVKYLGSAVLTMYHGGQAATVVAAQLGIPVRGWGIGLLYAGIAALLLAALVRGVRFAAVVILAVEACSLAFIIGLMLLSPEQRVPVAGGSDVLLVAMAALFALAGFESATFFAPETRRPLVTVTRVVRVTPVLCGVLFIFAAWAAWSGKAGTVVNAYLSGTAGGAAPALVLALHIGLTCSWLASAMASANTASRLVYSMSLEGVLPRGLSAVHARLRTPYVALAGIVAVVAAGAAGFAAYGGVPADTKTAIRTALVIAYILVAVAAVRFLRRIGELRGVDLPVGVIAATALTLTLGALVVSGARAGVFVAAGVVAAVAAGGLLWYRHLARRHPRTLTAIGVFDSPESADVLPGAGVFAETACGRVALVGAQRAAGP